MNSSSLHRSPSKGPSQLSLLIEREAGGKQPAYILGLVSGHVTTYSPSHRASAMTREGKILRARSWMSALIRRVKASSFLTLNYSLWNRGTQLKRFENSSITSIRFKHKNSLLVSSGFTPVGDGSRGLYGDIKSNRSDPGNLKFVWFVAVSFGRWLWSFIRSDKEIPKGQ